MGADLRVNKARYMKISQGGKDMKHRFYLPALLALVALIAAACGGGGAASTPTLSATSQTTTLPSTQPGATSASQPTSAPSGPPTALPLTGGSYPAVPAEYANKQPPFSLTSSNTINQGKAIYTSDCAPCHGNSGKGDGPAAASLNPKPLDFASEYSKNMPLDFRYWRISAGVANTAMPAWGSSLSSDQIWEVIAYELTFAK
jgi:mono/diheme cytochrome c family protein